MNELIELFLRHGAADAAIIKYSDCEIINQRLADKISFSPRSVCIGLLPYYTAPCNEPRSVSSYALAYDYHALIASIGAKIIADAKQLYPDSSFQLFGDHSPINEKTSAAKAGLGIIGEHSLLITPKYSSFVFIFEIVTDIEFDCEAHDITQCEKCGKCIQACPVGIYDKSLCLSALTQKKGELNSQEKALIKASGCAWGCDVCQMACPHTAEAIKSGTIYSHLSWFNAYILSKPSAETVSDEHDFNRRAYSWRGTSTILRNIDIINTDNDELQPHRFK